MLNEESLNLIASPSSLLKGQGGFASSPAGQALNQADYGAALKCLDERLVETPGSFIDRLWWVRCQYELQSLPVTALSSPLEEMYSQLLDGLADGHADVAELAVVTFTQVALRLRERNYSKLGTVICEKAVELAQRAKQLPTAVTELSITSYHSLLNEELARATKRGEPKAYLAAIQKKIDSAPVVVATKRATTQPAADLGKPAQETKKTTEKNTENTTDKFTEKAWEMGDAVAVLTNKSLERSSTSRSQRAEPEAAPLVNEEPNPNTLLSGRERTSNAPFLIMLLVALGLALWFFVLRGPTDEEISQRLAMLPAAGEMKFILPEIAVRSLAEVVAEGQPRTIADPSLDSLSSRLEKLSVDKEPELNKPEPHEPQPQPQPQPQPEPAPKELPPASSLDPRKAPLLNPETLKSTTVENLGGDPRATVVPRAGSAQSGVAQNGVAQNVVAQDGGSPGSADKLSVRDPYERPGRALDGSPIRSYPVERFNTPLTFKTITATNVLEAPSVLAPAIDRLTSDAVIKVSSRMGKWLEIQSTGGRRGFIYAQDAIEVQ